MAADEVRDVVRGGASLLPQLARAVERCRTEPDPGQDLARCCGRLIGAFQVLRDRLDELPPTELTGHVDRLLHVEQRIVEQAARLAFRPHDRVWHRLAGSFGDGLSASADELLLLAASL